MLDMGSRKRFNFYHKAGKIIINRYPKWDRAYFGKQNSNFKDKAREQK
ncbi:MAG: hypothetical protein ACI9TY_000273 [Alphaproteobacteria bacterium]|jgi:hypothetical protein